MPRRGENIYKRKDGRWEGRFIQGHTSSGKAIYCYLYASSYKEVKQKMEQAKSNDKESLQAMTIARDSSNITFQDVALGWVNSIIPQVKESTYVKYENLLKCYILPDLGEKPVPDISHETVEALCNSLLIYGGKKGQGLSPKTVSDSLTIIRSILQYSVKKGIVACCSAQSVIIKQQSKKMQVLSRREQEKLCSFLLSNLNERNLGILVCLFTGLRIGEICALKWGDISLSEQVINVRFTIQRIQDFNSVGKKTKIIITSPKSACSCRTIPLPPELVILLRRYKSSDNAYVLTGISESEFCKAIHCCAVESLFAPDDMAARLSAICSQNSIDIPEQPRISMYNSSPVSIAVPEGFLFTDVPKADIGIFVDPQDIPTTVRNPVILSGQLSMEDSRARRLLYVPESDIESFLAFYRTEYYLRPVISECLTALRYAKLNDQQKVELSAIKNNAPTYYLSELPSGLDNGDRILRHRQMWIKTSSINPMCLSRRTGRKDLTRQTPEKN